MPLLVQLAGLWIARDIAAGKYPPKLAIPLSLLISRLGAPGLLAGVVGLALDRYSDLKKDGAKRRPTSRRKPRRQASAKRSAS